MVGNRQAGTVVKVGLYEAGQCIDRNGNGNIESSLDTDDDGNITGSDFFHGDRTSAFFMKSS